MMMQLGFFYCHDRGATVKNFSNQNYQLISLTLKCFKSFFSNLNATFYHNLRFQIGINPFMTEAVII